MVVHVHLTPDMALNWTHQYKIGTAGHQAPGCRQEKKRVHPLSNWTHQFTHSLHFHAKDEANFSTSDDLTLLEVGRLEEGAPAAPRPRPGHEPAPAPSAEGGVVGTAHGVVPSSSSAAATHLGDANVLLLKLEDGGAEPIHAHTTLNSRWR